MDIARWHEIAGIFVVEVKALTLDEIEYFGWQRCKIRGRDEDSGPPQQAHKALPSFGKLPEAAYWQDIFYQRCSLSVDPT